MLQWLPQIMFCTAGCHQDVALIEAKHNNGLKRGYSVQSITKIRVYPIIRNGFTHSTSESSFIRNVYKYVFKVKTEYDKSLQTTARVATPDTTDMQYYLTYMKTNLCKTIKS